MREHQSYRFISVLTLQLLSPIFIIGISTVRLSTRLNPSPPPGNGCVLPLHEEGTRAHSNRLRMRSACSCGRSISYRSDPFALDAANHEFYSSLSEKCCSTLPQHRTFGRPQLSWMICTLGSASGYQTTLGLEQPGFLLGAQFLLPWDLPPDEAWNPEPKNAWRGKRSAR